MTDNGHKYMEIVRDIRELIANGVYKPGDPLDKQKDLQKTYGVSLGTVVKAMNVLRSEGLVTMIQGKGTFVRNRLTDADRNDIERFGEMLFSRYPKKARGTTPDFAVAFDATETLYISPRHGWNFRMEWVTGGGPNTSVVAVACVHDPDVAIAIVKAAFKKREAQIKAQKAWEVEA